MQVEVHFFALYRERAGRNHLDLEVEPETTVSGLVEEIRRLFPELAPPAVDIVVAVNTEYSAPGHGTERRRQCSSNPASKRR